MFSAYLETRHSLLDRTDYRSGGQYRQYLEIKGFLQLKEIPGGKVPSHSGHALPAELRQMTDRSRCHLLSCSIPCLVPKRPDSNWLFRLLQLEYFQPVLFICKDS